MLEWTVYAALLVLPGIVCSLIHGVHSISHMCAARYVSLTLEGTRLAATASQALKPLKRDGVWCSAFGVAGTQN